MEILQGDRKSALVGVVLGASRFPGRSIDSEEHAAAFLSSKEAVTRLLLAVAREVLDLFDVADSPDQQCEQIGSFLADRQAETKDVIVYYVGHGDFLRAEEYGLHLRRASRVPHASVLRVGDLASTFEQAFQGRIYVILDCCFAGSAVDSFQTNVATLVDKQWTREPRSGIALLNASSRNKPAVILRSGKKTMFSDCLCAVLTAGVPHAGAKLSFRQLGDAIQRRIRTDYPDDRKVWPEVHSPRQEEGIALENVPLFPNPVTFPEIALPPPPPRVVARIAPPPVVAPPAPPARRPSPPPTVKPSSDESPVTLRYPEMLPPPATLAQATSPAEKPKPPPSRPPAQRTAPVQKPPPLPPPPLAREPPPALRPQALAQIISPAAPVAVAERPVQLFSSSPDLLFTEPRIALAPRMPVALAPAAPAPRRGPKPTVRNPQATLLGAYGIYLGLSLIGNLIIAKTGIQALAFAPILAAYLGFMLYVRPLLRELDAFTGASRSVWWRVAIPFIGWYYLWLVVPDQVARAKESLGIGASRPRRARLAYFLFLPYALAADLNDIAAA